MSLLKFDQYIFDMHCLELRADGVAVTLRPKTAELLRVLLSERECVLSKRALIKRIWHTEYVTDQSVFQAMSELRAQLAPLKAIRTFPNRGYQWVLPVTVVRQNSTVFVSLCTLVQRMCQPFIRQGFFVRWLVLPLLSALALLSSTNLSETNSNEIIYSYSPTHNQVNFDALSQRKQLGAFESIPTFTRLPAIVAFSDGASSLQAGDTQRAVTLLQLSVAERPEFVEARLLLAEAHLLNGSVLLAREQANAVMNSLTPQNNAYSIVAAMDLISRADEHLGQMTSALTWATRAADQANSNGFECTAADLHDRVLALVQESHQSPTELQASPVFASRFAHELLQTALSRRQQSSYPMSVAQQENIEPDPGSGVVTSDRMFSATSADGRSAHCARFRGGSSGLTPVPASDASKVKRLLSRMGRQVGKHKPLI